MVPRSPDPESFVKEFCAAAKEGMQPYRNKLLTIVTYQLPVPCGDCSVHLLINKEGITLSAFIMYGGRDAQGLKASLVVHAGLWLIAEIHNIKGPYLRAWVVTHWDRDHNEGVLGLLISGTLKGFVVTEDFSLYCATDKKVVPKATGALKDSGIQATVKIGTSAIGYNFFGRKFNEHDVGFWCVGGDGYSYTKGSFKLPPTPLET